MSSAPHRIVTFRGGVSCRRDSGGPLGLTLIGWTSEHPDERVSLAFSGPAPQALPEVLEDLGVDRIAPGQYRLRSGSREWLVDAKAIHLHREVSVAFYGAIAPRTAPWGRRLFWRLLLALAANKWGKRLLLALRR